MRELLKQLEPRAAIRVRVTDQSFGRASGQDIREPARRGHEMLAQYPFCTMLQFKEAEVQQADHLRLIAARSRPARRRYRNGGSRILIDFEPSSQFLADSQAPQTRFGCGPEEILFSRKMPENSDFANPCQPGDLMSATGGETLSREQLHGGFHDAVRGAVWLRTLDTGIGLVVVQQKSFGTGGMRIIRRDRAVQRQPASNSTATLCWMSSTVITTRKPFALRTSTPAKPISEPPLIRTL